MQKAIRKGFTLIELTIVVFLVGFLLSIVFSSVRNLFSSQVTPEVEVFTSSLKHYFKQAQLKNSNIIFELDIDNQNYTVKQNYFDEEEGLKEEEIFKKELSSNVEFISVIDVNGIVYDSGIIKIPFTYDGVGADYIIHIGQDREVENSIILYRYGGRVSIKSGKVETFEIKNKEDAVDEI